MMDPSLVEATVDATPSLGSFEKIHHMACVVNFVNFLQVQTFLFSLSKPSVYAEWDSVYNPYQW